MKKLVLSMALLAGMTFVACSSDDDNNNSNNNNSGDNCVTCTVTFEGQSTNNEVCESSYDSSDEYQTVIAAFEQNGATCN